MATVEMSDGWVELASGPVICNPKAVWELIASFLSMSPRDQTRVLDLIMGLSRCLLHSPSVLLEGSIIPGEGMKKRYLLNHLIEMALRPLPGTIYVKLKELVVFLVNSIGVKRENTYFLVRLMAAYDMSGDALLKAIEFLELLILPKLCESPHSFFYFSGEGAELKLTLQDTWMFPGGFTCCMWIRIETIQGLEPSILFAFHCEGYGGISCFMIESELHYIVLGDKYDPEKDSEGIFVCQLPCCEWVFLVVEHEKSWIRKSHLRVVVNGNQVFYSQLEYPKIKDKKVMSGGICRNFIGQLGGFMLFNESLGLAHIKMIHNCLGNAPVDYEIIEGMYAKTAKSLEKKVVMLYHPSRTDHSVVYDCYGDNHGELVGMSGVKIMKEETLRFLCGIETLLPILKKILELSTGQGRLLEEWLLLLLSCLRHHSKDQSKAHSSGFFKAFPELLFSFSPGFFTFSHILIIEEIISVLNSCLKEHVLLYFLVCFEYWGKTAKEIQGQVIIILKRVYASCTCTMLSVYGVQDLLGLTLQYSRTATSTLVHSVVSVLEFLFMSGDAQVSDLKHAIEILYAPSPDSFKSHIVSLFITLMKPCERSALISPEVLAKQFVECHGISTILYLMSTVECTEVKATCIELICLVYTRVARCPNFGTYNDVWAFISSEMLLSAESIIEKSTTGLGDIAREVESEEEKEIDIETLSISTRSSPILSDFELVEHSEEENAYMVALYTLLNMTIDFHIIDEAATMHSLGGLSLLQEVVDKGNLYIKYRVIQDLHVLTRRNTENAIFLGSNLEFHHWFLDLLFRSPTDSDTESAILSNGIRIHTNIISSCLTEEGPGWTTINNTVNWYKKNEKALNFTRNILISLFSKLESATESLNNTQGACLWKNLVLVNYLLEEISCSPSATMSIRKLLFLPENEDSVLSRFSTTLRSIKQDLSVEDRILENLPTTLKRIDKLKSQLQAITQGKLLISDDTEKKFISNSEEKARIRRMNLKSIMSQQTELRGLWKRAHCASLCPFPVMDTQLSRPLLKQRPHAGIPYTASANRFLPEHQLSSLPSEIMVKPIESPRGSSPSSELEESPINFSFSNQENPLASLPSNETSCISVGVGIVYPLTAKYGQLQLVLSNTQCKLRFIYDKAKSSQFTATVELFEYQPSSNKRYIKEWDVCSLQYVIPKTYVLRHRAAEFVFRSGKTVMVNFDSFEKRFHFLRELRKLNSSAVSRLYLILSPDPCALFGHTNITLRWKNWEISNFEYLMYLNLYAGRSYHDLTQYPVLPWVLADYTSSEINLSQSKFYRDLTRNMGSLGPTERLAKFIDRYESLVAEQDFPPFHFGSHYSNPGIVLYYLIRMFPYSEGARELQGGKFDVADRLFKRIQTSFHSATDDIADVKELIPEFYTTPEFLMNLDQLEFGETQAGTLVDAVQLPPWAKTPYDFIRIQRQALESRYVSNNLHHWIDLVFGYKQTGIEAIREHNVFHCMTYENNIDLDKELDLEIRKSLESQVVYFGKTPSQLFRKPHPMKKLKEEIDPVACIADKNASLRVFSPVSQNTILNTLSVRSCMELPKTAILHMKLEKDELYCLKQDGSVSVFTWSQLSRGFIGLPFSLFLEKEIRLNNQHRDYSFLPFNPPVLLLSLYPAVVQGGYWDGRITISNLRTKEVGTNKPRHHGTVTCLESNANEKVGISGSRDGDVIVWHIMCFRWVLRWEYFDHEGAVTSVDINEELRLFGSTSVDGTCNVYSEYKGKLIRVIEAPGKLPVSCMKFASCAPATIILYSSVAHRLYSYSLNGQLLHEVEEMSPYISRPQVYCNLDYSEYLIYGSMSGDITIRSTSDLEVVKKVFVVQESQVLFTLMTPDKRFIISGCGNGTLPITTNQQPEPPKGAPIREISAIVHLLYQ